MRLLFAVLSMKMKTMYNQTTVVYIHWSRQETFTLPPSPKWISFWTSRSGVGTYLSQTGWPLTRISYPFESPSILIEREPLNILQSLFQLQSLRLIYKQVVPVHTVLFHLVHLPYLIRLHFSEFSRTVSSLLKSHLINPTLLSLYFDLFN